MSNLIRVLFGTCPCGVRFWWTGSKQDCPPCGNCKRAVQPGYWFRERSIEEQSQ